MTTKRYLAEPASLAGSATVTGLGTDARGPYLHLDQTWFHAQGGGQKADLGTICRVPVLHVAHSEGGEVHHYVAEASGFAVGDAVSMEIDPDWRQGNARLHTAGHLIAAVVERLFPALRGVSGHHWPAEARVEFEGASGRLPSVDELRSVLEPELERAAAADLAVRIIGDPYTSRQIRIGDYTPIGCGGTHLERTGPLAGVLQISAIRAKGGKLRVSYGA